MSTIIYFQLSSGSNLGYAMARYARQAGLRVFFFHPKATLYKLDAANFDGDGVTAITVVPGIFVAGTAVGGTQWRLKHAMYTSHNHVARIVKAITGQVPRRLGAAEPHNSDNSWEEIKGNS
jgi:threonine synthase